MYSNVNVAWRTSCSACQRAATKRSSETRRCRRGPCYDQLGPCRPGTPSMIPAVASSLRSQPMTNASWTGRVTVRRKKTKRAPALPLWNCSSLSTLEFNETTLKLVTLQNRVKLFGPPPGQCWKLARRTNIQLDALEQALAHAYKVCWSTRPICTTVAAHGQPEETTLYTSSRPRTIYIVVDRDY